MNDLPLLMTTCYEGLDTPAGHRTWPVAHSSLHNSGTRTRLPAMSTSLARVNGVLHVDSSEDCQQQCLSICGGRVAELARFGGHTEQLT
jgi:hypothetical protein